MTLRDYTANVISASKVVPDGNFKDSKASGVWDINEALDLIKGGNWPNAANFNPAAFVDGLFQTHLYTGNGGTQTITNNINLSGSGGLVWTKRRDSSSNGDHTLYDTERGTGTGGRLRSNNNQQAYSPTDAVTAFNNNGFSIGADASINTNGAEYVSWTFRKQPKFFDIVTYTGDGSNGRAINHNLGSVPGMIIIKILDTTDHWTVYHRGIDSSQPEDYRLRLNSTDARSDAPVFADTAPTSTQFTVGAYSETNGNGNSFIAYLFAHNDNDGGFGEPGDQDIIKCDSYTGNGSSTGPSVNLGFEPQLVMIKNASSTQNWWVLDNMRGIVSGAEDIRLKWNASDAEDDTGDVISLTPTGFDVTTSSSSTNTNGDTYVYMAIRRGGMQTPTAASSVFAVDSLGSTGDGAAPAFRSPFVADMGMRVDSGEAYTEIGARLTQDKWLYTNLNNTEATANNSDWDYQNGWYTSTSTASNYHGLMWARARGYFDVVTYSGTGSTRNLSHNLGVAPEMMWIKPRDLAFQWSVYHKDVSNSSPYYELKLNDNDALGTSGNTNAPFAGNPTATTIPLPSGTASASNRSGYTYIAYLFATVAGVSKVGSFTQSGATNVDCGFTGSTPALIILKRTDSTGDWYIFDSLRGIIAGNDPYKVLNEQTAAVTNADVVDPYSSGFATTSTLTNGNYIFYAIAATS